MYHILTKIISKQIYRSTCTCSKKTDVNIWNLTIGFVVSSILSKINYMYDMMCKIHIARWWKWSGEQSEENK